MDCAIRVISEVLKWCLGKELKPGVIAVLHTYGRDLRFNPHLHLLVIEGDSGKMVSGSKKVYFRTKY
jgi:hypothetical protein